MYSNGIYAKFISIIKSIKKDQHTQWGTYDRHGAHRTPYGVRWSKCLIILSKVAINLHKT